MRRWLCGVAALALLLGGAAPARAADPDIVAQLRAVPGLTVVRENAAPAGYRHFSLTFRQPTDHRQPAAGTFEQRLTLLHRTTAAPMVLHTTGYYVYFGQPFRSELTSLLGANQIAVEQRFFSPSRPQPVDWTKLTIWQAATDHHRIIEAIKPLYAGRWISTGESKGGMTSVYHRRFYPDDVAATVAYVAPNDTDPDSDSHAAFFDRVGTDAACRAKIRDFQRKVLLRRAQLVPMYADIIASRGGTLRSVGGPDRALERSVMEMPWMFWQRGGQGGCQFVPTGDLSDEDLLGWLNNYVTLDGSTDQAYEPYIAYLYQAGTELGYPSPEFPHLAGLLRYPDVYGARSRVPPEIPMRFDRAAMPDIDSWVRGSGSELMFVYGEYDPWSAEPFTLGPGTRDSFWYEAPRGSHGITMKNLPAAQYREASAAVRRWAGLPASFRPGPRIPALDDWQPPRDDRPL